MARCFTRALSCKLISLPSHDLSLQVWVLSLDLHLPAQPARKTETHYHQSRRSTTTMGGAKEISFILHNKEVFIVNFGNSSDVSHIAYTCGFVIYIQNVFKCSAFFLSNYLFNICWMSWNLNVVLCLIRLFNGRFPLR